MALAFKVALLVACDLFAKVTGEIPNLKDLKPINCIRYDVTSQTTTTPNMAATATTMATNTPTMATTSSTMATTTPSMPGRISSTSTARTPTMAPINTPITYPTNISAKALCRDFLTIYADGILIGRHSSNKTAGNFILPENTMVIGIQCTASKDSPAVGILASFHMEYPGDYVTDSTWRCSANFVPGWEKSTFDDTDWLYATTFGNNNTNGNQTLDQSLTSDIASHANWIWTSNYLTESRDTNVYCKGHIGISRVYSNYGRKFAVGFVDNSYIINLTNNVSIDTTMLVLTTLIPTGVTVYCFTPHITHGSRQLSEVRTVTAGKLETIEIPNSLRHEGGVIDGDQGILCIATAPVKLVGEIMQNFSTDVFLIIPLDALGSPDESLQYFSVNWDRLDGGILIIAAYDNTRITIKPANYLTFGPSNQSSILSVALNKYRTIQLADSEENYYGTHITSDKPITVYSGNKRTHIQGTNNKSDTADHLIVQLMPVSNWGDRFVIPPLPYFSQDNLALFKVVSAQAETIVQIKHYEGTTLNGTEIYKLGAGESVKYSHPVGQAAFVNSSNGILLALFATSLGGECFGNTWLQLIPPLYQFDRDYTLHTPKLQDGCPIHFSATIIIKTTEINDIQLNGTLLLFGNATVWDHSIIPETNYSALILKLPFGVNRIQHAKPNVNFGMLSNGFEKWNSYGSTAGTRTAPINDPCIVSASTRGDGLDNDCDGNIDEDFCTSHDPTKDCAAPEPINGGWNNWTMMANCVCQFANGTKGIGQYYRTCSNPIPKYNGWGCSGNTMKEDVCSC